MVNTLTYKEVQRNKYLLEMRYLRMASFSEDITCELNREFFIVVLAKAVASATVEYSFMGLSI